MSIQTYVTGNPWSIMIELYILYLYFSLLNYTTSLLYLLQIYNYIYLVRDLIRSAWINFITYGYFVAKWEDLVSRFTLSVYKPLYKGIYKVGTVVIAPIRSHCLCEHVGAYLITFPLNRGASNHVFFVRIFLKLQR